MTNPVISSQIVMT